MDVGRSSILVIGGIGVAAVIFAMRFIKPAGEQAEARQKVLTEAYQPLLVECVELAFDEIPEPLPRPGVDEDLVYVAIVVLYPGVERVPDPGAHRLIGVNGKQEAMDPANVDYEVTEDGALMTLVFKANNAFQFARLVRGEETVLERVGLE
jgi:hypothetical protein